MTPETYLIAGLLLAILLLQVVLFFRRQDQRPLEQALREEQREGRAELRQQLDGLSSAQAQRIDGFGARLTDFSTRTDQRLDVLRAALNEDARKARSEGGEQQQRLAEALGLRLNELTQRNEQRIGEMRATLETQLQKLQADNAQKLEQMRATVDEKLHATLETRLGHSFKLVSERLEAVQRGLGEMQALATGVGDLKRVLTNVKTRGTFGEVQLGALLEQVLVAEQYAADVATVPGSTARVEYAIRLPGGTDDGQVWLPIDAKFPREDYERLLDAHDRADVEAAAAAAAALERRIRDEAKAIHAKYVSPPHTTDFAILFLPTEGLFAELIRRPGLFELLQRESRVTLAGPTTLNALLNSLQMGFRTLAIEKRSSEVWQLLGAVKGEFGKFAGILEKAEKQISTVGRSIGEASRKTRTIERRLKKVELMDGTQVPALVDDDGGKDTPDEVDEAGVDEG
ncbi:MAG: DNA recombination protein RmuC [Luteimonas sp.]